PFFADLPSEIHSSMYPDILHQLLQGVIKHLVSWIKQIVGQKELDLCFQSQPPAHGVQHYESGFPDFGRLTGKEIKDLFAILPGAICGSSVLQQKGADGIRVMKATCALAEFYHLANFPVHSDQTLPLMRKALLEFHKNKAGFTSLENPFCIPKVHMLSHFVWALVEGGSLRGFDTQMSERLHADKAKDPFRSSSRRIDTATKEMAKWVERQEAIEAFCSLVSWRQ
ncbi:hypothetical protein CALCODRAFT_420227, partial [Calocera cornea HHB12733]